ncbi:MAG: hypothetical protein K2N34_02460 [Lachnospiraceae bacterium]|nr:hypothetical protein [Lachnospiraceae bacterium]
MDKGNELLWEKKYLDEKAKTNRLEVLYRTAGKWLELFSRGISLESRLREWGIKRFVIYGASKFSLRMLDCCEREKIAVAAITDKRITVMGGLYNDIPLIPVQNLQNYAKSDGYIIVTAMGYFEEIRSELEHMGCQRILSLEQLLDGKERVSGGMDGQLYR